jgi:hypothetical protein
MDIRKKTPVGGFMRMTDRFARYRAFAAYRAPQSHLLSPCSNFSVVILPDSQTESKAGHPRRLFIHAQFY